MKKKHTVKKKRSVEEEIEVLKTGLVDLGGSMLEIIDVNKEKFDAMAAVGSILHSASDKTDARVDNIEKRISRLTYALIINFLILTALYLSTQ